MQVNYLDGVSKDHGLSKKPARSVEHNASTLGAQGELWLYGRGNSCGSAVLLVDALARGKCIQLAAQQFVGGEGGTIIIYQSGMPTA
jgi:hypothetical protein